jgi:CubicO group peptidase (beta-lactamase class C family)
MARSILLILVFHFFGAINAQQLYFPPRTGTTWDTLSPARLGWCNDSLESLHRFLEAKNTKGFIVLKNGKIVVERYYGTFTRDSAWYWASAGKTLTAFLTGIAQEEGKLRISDTSAKYLGNGWSSLTPAQEAAITVRHHLTMTTGLDDAVADDDCTLPSCLTYKAAPGTRWAYHNAPYTLMEQIVENAVGVTYNQFTTSRLKTPTGMTGQWFKIGYNNVYFSTPRSMARFGLLILNNGVWNGDTILHDRNYFRDMVNTSQNINLSYGYLWWLNGKASHMLPTVQFVFNGSMVPAAPNDMFAALGKNDQKIYVIPSQKLVVVRMGNAAGNVQLAASSFDNELWTRISRLSCLSQSVDDKASYDGLHIFGNPAGNTLRGSSLESGKLEVFDATGRLLMREQIPAGNWAFDTHRWPKGLVYVRVEALSGRQTRVPVLVQAD